MEGGSKQGLKPSGARHAHPWQQMDCNDSAQKPRIPPAVFCWGEAAEPTKVQGEVGSGPRGGFRCCCSIFGKYNLAQCPSQTSGVMFGGTRAGWHSEGGVGFPLKKIGCSASVNMFSDEKPNTSEVVATAMGFLILNNKKSTSSGMGVRGVFHWWVNDIIRDLGSFQVSALPCSVHQAYLLPHGHNMVAVALASYLHRSNF